MTDSHGRRIVAVVVTFNRLDMLRRQLARLAEVPELDEVLVVDNASTDGTGEWLRTQPVTAELLTENTGGAGGFSRGLELAVDRGADLAWLMDDDGLPAADCLARCVLDPCHDGLSGQRSASAFVTPALGPRASGQRRAIIQTAGAFENCKVPHH